MNGWTAKACPAVERNPEKIGGAWAFTGPECRCTPPFENLTIGATIDELVAWFPGVDKQQVRAVLEREATVLRAVLIR